MRAREALGIGEPPRRGRGQGLESPRRPLGYEGLVRKGIDSDRVFSGRAVRPELASALGGGSGTVPVGRGALLHTGGGSFSFLSGHRLGQPAGTRRPRSLETLLPGVPGVFPTRSKSFSTAFSSVCGLRLRSFTHSLLSKPWFNKFCARSSAVVQSDDGLVFSPSGTPGLNPAGCERVCPHVLRRWNKAGAWESEGGSCKKLTCKTVWGHAR